MLRKGTVDGSALGVVQGPVQGATRRWRRQSALRSLSVWMSVQAMTDGRRAWEQTGGRRAWYQTALRRWGCQHAHQMLPRPRAVVPGLRCLRVHLRLLDKRQRLWIQAWVIQLRLRLWLWRQGQRLKTPLRLTRRQGDIDDRNTTTGGRAASLNSCSKLDRRASWGEAERFQRRCDRPQRK